MLYDQILVWIGKLELTVIFEDGRTVQAEADCQESPEFNINLIKLPKSPNGTGIPPVPSPDSPMMFQSRQTHKWSKLPPYYKWFKDKNGQIIHHEQTQNHKIHNKLNRMGMQRL